MFWRSKMNSRMGPKNLDKDVPILAPAMKAENVTEARRSSRWCRSRPHAMPAWRAWRRTRGVDGVALLPCPAVFVGSFLLHQESHSDRTFMVPVVDMQVIRGFRGSLKR